ncbi:MAG: hypothetical protein G01um101438_125 [Parcubacteria group bacterium Gr01-1014_38]|nr:MAG: hypothetical protein G01um101438_125 [Parcubacteria group bacterium Gr01-1014_38]
MEKTPDIQQVWRYCFKDEPIEIHEATSFAAYEQICTDVGLNKIQLLVVGNESLEPGLSGEDVVATARAAGFRGPILLCSSIGPAVQRQRQAGGPNTHVAQKPDAPKAFQKAAELLGLGWPDPARPSRTSA